MTDINNTAETYANALRRIHVDENGVKVATYFGWGIELQYDETSKNVQLVNTRYKAIHASVTPEGIITLNPIPSKEELDAMDLDPEVTMNGFQKPKYGYFLYLSYQAFEQFLRTMGLFDTKVRMKRDKGNNTFIWTAADEVTPIKERKCPTCRGFRKISGNCHTGTHKDCLNYDCPEAIAKIEEAKSRKPYIKVLPQSVIKHDHINICVHGLTSSHEVKLAQECWACSGSGKKIAGGNPRYRKWFGNNTIVINPDFSYAIEPSEVHPEYHGVHWKDDLS